jgi:MYXO-CTERM domain-containing protein
MPRLAPMDGALVKTVCRRLARFSWCAALLAACTAAPGEDLTLAQLPLMGGQINGDALPAKTVVLTYDDGPDEHTLALARYLSEQGVKATFFVNGRRFCKTFDAGGACTTPQDTRPCIGAPQAPVTNPKYYPESLLDEVIALGHRVANHTQDHCHLPGQTNADNLVFEVKATQDILDRHICDGVFLFRAPYGEWSGTVLGRLGAGMGIDKIVGPINWDVDGNDWDCWRMGLTPEGCATRYLNILNGRGKGIFLMHDRPEFNVGSENPLLMARNLVPRLKTAGYSFATMDEVLRLPPRPPGAPACPAKPADGGAPDATATVDAAGATDVSAPAGDAAGTGGTGGAGGAGGAGNPTGGGQAGGAGGTAGASASGGGGGAGGSTGGGGRSGTGGAGTGTGGNAPPPGPSGQSGSGGCSVAVVDGGDHTPALALLLGLAGAALLRRRRTRP